MSKAEEQEKSLWGTWEELLLACAVNRHGTKSWDSVAKEIQNRSSFPHLLTAQNCKQAYYDLQRRFRSKDEITDEEEDDSINDENINNNNNNNINSINHTNNNSSSNKKIPWWLDELRKLRVAELRREVQRYDVSIVSLQLKVQKLKEEREHSLKETENDEEKPDLKKDTRTEEKEEGAEDKPPPENDAGNCISGDESDHENQSFNSSNSTNPKAEDRKSGAEEPDDKPEKEDEIADGQPDPVPGGSPDGKEVGEGSYDGSSDTIAKGTEVSPFNKFSGDAPVTGESAEFRESFAESKEREEGVKENSDEGVKENSDVQSSVTLSRKSRREKVTGNSGDSPVTHEIYPVVNRISVKSPPLVDFLEIIRSHKYGSVFQRRLESQETADYQVLIRQHVDLEMIRKKLDEGSYSSNRLQFFRDLLLLCNNAIVFFPNDSKESVAARNLRKIVTKEMAIAIQKLDHRSREPTPTPTPPLPSLPKFAPDPATKRSISGPIIVCRKRSSISAKAASLAVAEVKKEERLTKSDEKPENSSANAVVEEQIVATKRMRDRSAFALRTSRSSMNRKQNPNSDLVPENDEAKMEKKNDSAVAKKRSVANFLNRMKRSSSSNNGSLLDTLKSCVNSPAGSGKGRDQKKRERSDRRRKDQVLRQGSAGKSAEKTPSPPKRSVGRPPKRAAASATPPPAKRRKDTVEKLAPVVSRAPKKRGRR